MDDVPNNPLKWGSEVRKDGTLSVYFGRGDTIYFTLVELESLLMIEMANERTPVDDYAERPMLSAMVAAFTADRHERLDREWDVLELRDAACRAWEENIRIEEDRGVRPDHPLLGRCLLHLALMWANAYGPKRTS